ncbi:MAG: hypothetical protein A2X13_08205 [Bacteroidetes bacterium GWC2_33_15]|nr:MAG: hypothetical protein A2X10_12200 [Bacteroidetes bacterium GWA2_33_15]OFX51437.1 MAG: hypothetical protein A2X13_08205 [Bacteroidetes bacterium GWC2_33_15]HAN18514.1 hypothetical protein [Bacteroidales bacterium]
MNYLINCLKYFNRIYLIKAIISLLFVVLSFTMYAQDDNCTFKLEEAQNLYELGDLDSIPSMLNPCIEDGFSGEELSRAYKLLILTYLFEDNQEIAKYTMFNFLKNFPEYEIKANDPVEFTYLYKSYHTLPLYSIGVLAGINYSFIRIIEPYSVSNTNNYSGEYSYSGFGYQAGLQLKRYINQNIEINLDAIYTAKKFEYKLNQLDSKIEYKEDQLMFSFPLTGTYDFKLKNNKWSSFARMGVNVDYLLSATANIKRTIDPDASVDNISSSDIDILKDRNSLNISAVVGGGIKYYVKKGYVMFDARYHLGLTNNVVSENRYNKWGNYHYVDDDFAMNNLFFSVGYVRSFYKTKQKK